MAKVTTVNKDGVHEVWIERPDVHNAFDEEVIAELLRAFEEAGQDEKARAIVLGGRGKSFSAGADLEWMKRAAAFDEARNLADAGALARMLRALASSRLPTIARVQGAALGGGAGLVCACDIAIASRRALFGFSEVKLGIIPAVISPHVIRKLGAARAQELFILGERFDAEAALRFGMVSRVVEDEPALDKAVEETLAQLRTSSPAALASAKDLVRVVTRSLDDPVHVDQETARWIAKARQSADGKEGIGAFLEKRKPRWAT
jgi:methylglutaconyl-CoA hydratase